MRPMSLPRLSHAIQVYSPVHRPISTVTRNQVTYLHIFNIQYASSCSSNQGRTPPRPSPARVPRVLRAVDGRRAPVVGVPATAPILSLLPTPYPSLLAPYGDASIALGSTPPPLVLPMQQALALALERRVRKHAVVRPRVG
ncbi:hypothetical protein B0H13DRAFT_2679994 [Mycena leptocephala]|nr:hypothetical protein B0H13DRAFT_2679994 [Mycena leptocephala]